MERFEFILCPICSSSDCEFLLSTEMGNIVKCKRCGLFYRNPRLKPEIWFEILSKSSTLNIEETFYKSKKVLFSYIIKQIKNKQKHINNLLDIGCGYGVFLSIAKKNGWNVAGVELSLDASNYVKNKLGINVYTDDLCNLKLPEESYDVISLIEVIDYFSNPVGELKEVNRILKKDGLVVIRLNNGLWHLNLKKLDRIFRLFKIFPSVLHLCVFTPKTIKLLLEKTGFKNIEIYNSKFTKGDPYKSGGFLGEIFMQFIKNIVYFISQLIYYFTFKKVILAPTMLIYARKN